MSEATTNQEPGDRALEVRSEKDAFNQKPTSGGRNRHLLIVGAVAVVALLVVLVAFLLLRGRTAPPPTKAEASEESTTPNEVKLTPEALKASGIEKEGVTQRPAVALLKVTGTVETNPQQTQSVTALVSGRVQRVAVVIGDRVRAGSIVAVVSSPEVAEMHGKLREAETRLQLAERNLARLQRAENRVGVIQARAKLDEAEANLKRTKRLIELGVGAGKDLVAAEANYKTAKAEYDFQSNISLNREVQQAQAEMETARVDAGHIRQSLVTLDAHLSEGQRDKPNENISLVNIRAPVSGTVTERLVNAGAGIQPGTPLFTIANISTVWVIANVPESQVGSLHVGTPAELRSAAVSGGIAGHVNYIDPKLNEETRTARVRVEIANPGERLKAGMFVEVGFQTNTGASAGEELMVPATAVQRIGDRSVVFIPKEGEEGTFEARDVELGGEVDGYHRVLSGLKLGERVVTKGSFTLKTQLMKSGLGEE